MEHPVPWEDQSTQCPVLEGGRKSQDGPRVPGTTPLQLHVVVQFISNSPETLAQFLGGCILGWLLQGQLRCLPGHPPSSILDETRCEWKWVREAQSENRVLLPKPTPPQQGLTHTHPCSKKAPVFMICSELVGPGGERRKGVPGLLGPGKSQGVGVAHNPEGRQSWVP